MIENMVENPVSQHSKKNILWLFVIILWVQVDWELEFLFFHFWIKSNCVFIGEQELENDGKLGALYNWDNGIKSCCMKDLGTS